MPGRTLSPHLPLRPETRRVIGRPQSARMPKKAIVITVSRGDLIDENPLAEALESGYLAGAGLDVFEIEPLPDGSPLRPAPNTILPPQAAVSALRCPLPAAANDLPGNRYVCRCFRHDG